MKKVVSVVLVISFMLSTCMFVWATDFDDPRIIVKAPVGQSTLK